MKYLVYAIMVFIVVSCSNVSNEDSIRDTSQGLVIGTNYDNNTFAWKGIPFAKAPIGNLRWKTPEPAESWNGLLQACLLYTSPSPRDNRVSRMPSSA